MANYDELLALAKSPEQPLELRVKALELSASLAKEPKDSEKQKWASVWLNAPSVVVVVGLLTIGANYLSNLYLGRDASGNSITLEQKKFQFEVIRTALNDSKEAVQRANTLRFFTEIKLLDGLDTEQLKAWSAPDNAENLPSIASDTSRIGVELRVQKKPVDPKLLETFTEKAQASSSSRWMNIAIGELGVAEVPGPDFNARIMDYARDLKLQDRFPGEETPWSSLFVAWVLSQGKYQVGTDDLLMNRRWLKFGKQLPKEEFGAVAVFWRQSPDSMSGTSGFIVDWDDRTISILGGNLQNQVGIARLPRDRLLGIVWPN